MRESIRILVQPACVSGNRIPCFELLLTLVLQRCLKDGLPIETERILHATIDAAANDLLSNTLFWQFDMEASDACSHRAYHKL
jgi:hypothetical protein